jgi:hypothetical protein
MNFDEWWNDGKDTSRLKNYCESLLNTSSYDDDSKKRIEEELWYYSEEELEILKLNLLGNQIDPIEFGMIYTQTDINKKLREQC